MATKGKDPIIHAEAQVSAMQDILKRWIDANPSNAELQAFKNMKPGQWDNRTNEVFTRWVISTQTAHNTAHPDDKIKVDGWAGDQTLRALGKDTAAGKALKDLQDAGLDRFHHRTEAHPAKGQEVNPDIATKLPRTAQLAGQTQKGSSLGLMTTLGDDGMPTDHSPASTDALGPKIVGGAVAAGLVGAGGYAAWKSFGKTSFNATAPLALPNPTPAATPRLSAPSTAPVGESTARPSTAGVSAKPTGSGTRLGASATNAAESVSTRAASPATKVLEGELMPRGSGPTVGEKPLNASGLRTGPSAVGAVADDALRGIPKSNVLTKVFSPKASGLATVGFAGVAAGLEYADGGNLKTSAKAAVDVLPGAQALTGKTQIDRTNGLLVGGGTLAGAGAGLLIAGPPGAVVGGLVGSIGGGLTGSLREKTDEDYTNAQKELLPRLKDYAGVAAANVAGGDKIDTLTLVRDPDVRQTLYGSVQMELRHQKRETPEQEERFQDLRDIKSTLEGFDALEVARLALPSKEVVEAQRAEQRKYIAENAFTLGP